MNISDFYSGLSFDSYKYLGAHCDSNGTFFRTYAPYASGVSVTGDFSAWQEIPMMPVRDGNFYEIFCPDARNGMHYKYRIYDKDGDFAEHIDPFGYSCCLSDCKCSVISSHSYSFTDEKWLEKRTDCRNSPLNIYEVHLGGMRKKYGEYYSYSEIADILTAHVKENGYNYIEFMPLCEYPCDESWGYQGIGFFAPTSRYGSPDELMELIDKCHRRGLGVILDFVPVHLAPDSYALNGFGGGNIFDYPEGNMRLNQWGSLNFNISRGDVRSFLQSAANFWLDVFHFDGLRIDAVSNLIYIQGDSRSGINLHGTDFLVNMNTGLKMRHPTAILAAEDSTAYPKITETAENGGLGFDYKWDMGWLNDTLEFFSTSPMYRSRDYHKLTFSMMYFSNERFLLPLSHDENVHGKGTILNKMHGSYEEKFAQARALYMYMIAHSGKKLSFMGSEIGQLREWDEKREQDWELLKYPIHSSFNAFIREINLLYAESDALHYDYIPDNFSWTDCASEEDCIYAFIRKGRRENILAIFNFSDWDKNRYAAEISDTENAALLLNSDWQRFGGNSPEGSPNITRQGNKILLDIPSYSGILLRIRKDINT